jgi:hypothetical protein
MAQLKPTIENIKRLKVQPTPGEWFLIEYLTKTLADDYEIYFQPFLNGDRPDFVIMHKNIGVIIIEVKDWALNCYRIDKENKWYLKKGNCLLKSPFQQVYAYKHNIFNLHINGFVEKQILNKSFYKLITPFVYFHNYSKNEIANFHSEVSQYYSDEKKHNFSAFKERVISHEQHNGTADRLERKNQQIERDFNGNTLTEDTLSKLLRAKNSPNVLFDDAIYKDFKRLLQPPYHTLEEGKKITYEPKQANLIESIPEHKKIKGVAGSGKTVVLAKRAVNAHKRHKERVLILTYNMALKSYVHDRISDVRESFGWNNFFIINYHQFITQVLNQCEEEIHVPDHVLDKDTSAYLDQHYYSNEKLFEKLRPLLTKYSSIFMDEIQDFKPEWIKIIRDNFLNSNSEMVLFGDEKQNIYERATDDKKNSRTPNGFGAWEKLNKSIRQKQDSHILNLARSFQQEFFDGKYEIDSASKQGGQSQLLSLELNKIARYSRNNMELIADTIFENIRALNIHSNEVVILSSKTEQLREIDFFIRNKHHEKTITTCESTELFNKVRNIEGFTEELPKDIKFKKLAKINRQLEGIRKSKKMGFNLNSGLIKLATNHSFKGYEAPTVVLIVDERDNDEIIYAAITRAKFNIMIFTLDDCKYNEFFEKELELIK